MAFVFFWVNMNYRALVPLFRAMLAPDALCLGCGHGFTDEKDIHVEHILPPRHAQDWPRLHARNLRLLCASCNRTKGPKETGLWLDEQDGARLTNEGDRGRSAPPTEQLHWAL